MRKKRSFSSLDAVLCLVLAARIHRNGDAVRKTAKRLLPLIEKGDRSGIGRFVTAMAPLETVDKLFDYLTL